MLGSDLKLKLSASIEGGGFNRYAYAMVRQTRLENASDIVMLLGRLPEPRPLYNGWHATLGNLNALVRAIT